MKRRNIYRWLTLPLLLLTVVGLMFVGLACIVVSTKVSFSPHSQIVVPGQTFTVDVIVNTTVAIAGAQFDLSFDPSLVTALSVEEGDLLNKTDSNTFFRPGTIDNVEGTITGVACVITTPGGSMDSPVTLATITFIAGTTEGSSKLHLKKVIAGNKDGQAVAVQVYSGTVTVSADQ